jgi:hypothetical protein
MVRLQCCPNTRLVPVHDSHLVCLTLDHISKHVFPTTHPEVHSQSSIPPSTSFVRSNADGNNMFLSATGKYQEEEQLALQDDDDGPVLTKTKGPRAARAAARATRAASPPSTLSPSVLKQDPSSLQSLGQGYIPHSPRDVAPASHARLLRRGQDTPNRNVSDHHRSVGNLQDNMFSAPQKLVYNTQPMLSPADV